MGAPLHVVTLIILPTSTLRKLPKYCLVSLPYGMRSGHFLLLEYNHGRELPKYDTCLNMRSAPFLKG